MYPCYSQRPHTSTRIHTRSHTSIRVHTRPHEVTHVHTSPHASPRVHTRPHGSTHGYTDPQTSTRVHTTHGPCSSAPGRCTEWGPRSPGQGPTLQTVPEYRRTSPTPSRGRGRTGRRVRRAPTPDTTSPARSCTDATVDHRRRVLDPLRSKDRSQVGVRGLWSPRGSGSPASDDSPTSGSPRDGLGATVRP